MKMSEYLDLLNKPITIPLSKIYSIKKYYLGMYRAYMVKMYDNGYISDPTRFNVDEINKNFIDLNIRHISDIKGMVRLESHFVGFIKCRNKNAEPEVTQFLSLLEKALYYKEGSSNIDKLYESVTKNSVKLSMKLIKRGAFIDSSKNNCGVDLINRGVFDCISEFGYTVKHVSILEDVFKFVLEKLGIPLSDCSKDGLFIDGLTHEEELLYSDIIFDESISYDGLYKNVIVDWMTEHKWVVSTKRNIERNGLMWYVCYERYDEVSSLQKRMLDEFYEKHKGTDVKVICMDSYHLYYVETCEDMLIPISQFVVLADEEESVLDEHPIGGYTGEVYSVDYLTSNEIDFTGCPIVVSNGIKQIEVVDVEQTELSDSESWFKSRGANLDFCGSYHASPFKEGTLEDRLYHCCINSENGEVISKIKVDFTESDLVKAKRKVFRKPL